MTRLIAEAGNPNLHPGHLVDKLFSDENLLPLRRNRLGGNKIDKPLVHGKPLVRALDINGNVTMELQEDYTSESSFSNLQGEYIMAVKYRLSNIAESGKNADTKTHVKNFETLHAEIIRSFSHQGGDRNFQQAIFDATIRLFEVFAQQHSNLLGVLEGMFKVAAGEGTADSILMSAQFLHEAKAGRLTRESLSQYVNIPEEEFSQAHTTHEGSCIAQDTAKMIMSSAALAAMELNKTTDISDYISSEKPLFGDRKALTDRIKKRVLALRK